MLPKFFLICALTLLPISAAVGQPPQDLPPAMAPEDAPSIAEYEEALEQLTQWSNKFGEINSYKEITVVKGETKKKFIDLSELDQHLFIILSGQNCSNTMMMIKHRWSVERNQLVRLEVLREGAQGGEPREGEVNSAKLAEFIEKLQELQKTHAKKFEATIIEIFDKYKTDIPEKDADLYLSNVRKFHDRFNLIDRMEGVDE